MAVNDVEATYTTGNNTTAVVDNNTNNQTGPQNVSVTTPSITQIASNVNKLTQLSDVNASTLLDGAIIQYDDTTKKLQSEHNLSLFEGNKDLDKIKYEYEN